MVPQRDSASVMYIGAMMPTGTFGGAPGNETLHVLMTTGEDPLGNRSTSHYSDDVIYPGLNKGLWNDVIMRILWHREQGELDVWHRIEGEETFRWPVSKRDVPTLTWRTIDGVDTVAAMYFLGGFYRNDEASLVNVHYQSDVLRGATFESVNVHDVIGTETGPAQPPSRDRNRWA